MSARPYLALQILQGLSSTSCVRRDTLSRLANGVPWLTHSSRGAPLPTAPCIRRTFGSGSPAFCPHLCHALLPLPRPWSPTAVPSDSEIINFPLSPLWAFQIHFCN